VGGDQRLGRRRNLGKRERGRAQGPSLLVERRELGEERNENERTVFLCVTNGKGG
jgi:hypothetical protein